MSQDITGYGRPHVTYGGFLKWGYPPIIQMINQLVLKPNVTWGSPWLKKPPYWDPWYSCNTLVSLGFLPRPEPGNLILRQLLGEFQGSLAVTLLERSWGWDRKYKKNLSNKQLHSRKLIYIYMHLYIDIHISTYLYLYLYLCLYLFLFFRFIFRLR